MPLTNKVRLDYLDSLRGIAALMVLVCHSLQVDASLDVPVAVEKTFESFKYGVQLFFVISGFTIFYSLYNGDQSTINFFIRRFFRIAPLYFLAVFFYGWLYRVDLSGIGLNLLFLHGFSPEYINSVVPGGWSIGVEVVFYCMVPFLFRKITNLEKSTGFFAITLLLSFSSFYIYRKLFVSSPELESFVYFWLPNQISIFALGFVTFFLIYGKRFAINKTGFIVGIAISFLVFIQLITKLQFFKEHIVFAIACAGLIYFLGQKNLPGLVNKATLFLGKVSYSLYLSQYAAIKLLKKTGVFSPLNGKVGDDAILNLLINLGLLFFVTAVLSFFLYHLIEAPFQNLGRQIIKKRTKTKPVKAGSVVVISNGPVLAEVEK